MVNIKIDGLAVSVPEDTTILEAAKLAGVEIPHLCYLKDINEIGACCVCVVEVKGVKRLVTSCNRIAEEGMEIYTNSPRVIAARKMNVQLVLSQHKSSCTSCVKSGNCTLQSVANDLGIFWPEFEEKPQYEPWDKTLPLIRDASKCIKCMRCIQICDKVQSLGVWDIVNTGSRTTVGLKDGYVADTMQCALCGQCVTHCPVGALRERDDVDRVIDAIHDPEITTVVQIAPAVRTAWGEGIGLDKEKATEKRLAATLKRLGVDYVFDTNFAADLTIMEEGSEFLSRMGDRENNKFPLFTSCCPGWVRFVKSQYPELMPQLSTAKSPQQMFGAVAKTYFAEKKELDPKKVFCVSVMPCIAKKSECDLPYINDSGADKDVDVVLTTRELDRLIRAMHIEPARLDEVEFDSPLGEYTGAGVIFGVTGGVMEAALRSAYYFITGENPDPDAFGKVRGAEGWRETEFDINGITVRTAVVNGLGNARKLIEKLKAGAVEYDFVEVMACPGGCVGGGGQPTKDGCELAAERTGEIYDIDRNSAIRFSHENPSVIKLYSDYLEKPLSHRAHELLHAEHVI